MSRHSNVHSADAAFGTAQRGNARGNGGTLGQPDGSHTGLWLPKCEFAAHKRSAAVAFPHQLWLHSVWFSWMAVIVKM